MEETGKVPTSRAALVLTHPGHELLVHSWLRQERPTVFVLTSGSATTSSPAVAETAAVLKLVGARRGDIFGRFTDQQWEETLLGRQFNLFHSLVADLTKAFVAGRVTRVVGDAAEGTCLAHDVCRAIVDTAVTFAARYLDHPVANLQFPLCEPAESRTDPSVTVWHHQLDEIDWSAKRQAMACYTQLPVECEQRQARYGASDLRHEWLLRAREERSVQQVLAPTGPSSRPSTPRAVDATPRVLRYQEQMAPLLSSLRQLRSVA